MFTFKLNFVPRQQGGVSNFKLEDTVSHFTDDPMPANNNFSALSCGKLAYTVSGFVFATVSFNRLTCRLQTIPKKSSERLTYILDTKACVKDQIHILQINIYCF